MVSKTNGFSVGMEDVTPATARALLKKNPRNRDLSASKVSHFASMMRDGGWRSDNGETIIVAKGGVLLDGQHRLAAVVKSGQTVRLLVVRGVPEDARTSIDTGTARTAADILNMHGVNYYNSVATLIRYEHAWSHGYLHVKLSSKNRVHNTHVMPLYDQIKSDAQTICARFKGWDPHVRAAPLLFLAWKTRQARGQKALADEFWADVGSGERARKESPAWRLRTRLYTSFFAQPTSPRRLHAEAKFGLAVRAWNMHMSGTKKCSGLRMFSSRGEAVKSLKGCGTYPGVIE